MLAKSILALFAFVAVAYVGWQIGAMLSTDAVALLIGFGLCFVCVAVPLCVLTLYGRKQGIVVHFHTETPKTLQQPTIKPTAVITAQRAQTWRVMDPSTTLAIREQEVTIYGD